jgi:hypothetical protein
LEPKTNRPSKRHKCRKVAWDENSIAECSPDFWSPGCITCIYREHTDLDRQSAARGVQRSDCGPRRLRTFFVDDYHLILGSSGDIDSGADAATRGYADEEFKDPTFVTYRRTPTTIVIAASGKRIAETGHFEGIWRKPDGTMRKTGIYLAMWIPSAGTWRLKSEAFVTLACTGSAACDQVS